MHRKIFLILNFIFLSSPLVYACNCPEMTLQARYEHSDTIMEVEVLRQHGEMRHLVTTDVRVRKVYKGGMQPGTTLVFGDSAYPSDDSCHVHFGNEARGERWLIFARSSENFNNGRWFIPICSRSAPVEFSKYEIRYLENIEKYRGRTRIHGFAPAHMIKYSGNSINGRMIAGPGTRITFRNGDREYKVTTDAEGFYELLDVPPGLYEATPELPPKVTAYEAVRIFYLPTPEIEARIRKIIPLRWPNTFADYEDTAKTFHIYLTEGGDAELSFRYSSLNYISGRVFGPDGKPVADAPVGLSKRDTSGVQHLQLFFTGKDGRFVIDRQMHGNYMINVNGHGWIGPKSPFGRHFYPGSLRRRSSRIVQLGARTRLENVDLHIPAFEKLVTISGRLVYADGSPVKNARAYFGPNGGYLKKYSDIFEDANPDGSFSLKVMRGTIGVVGGLILYGPEGANGCIDKTQKPVPRQDTPPQGFKFGSGYIEKIAADKNVSGFVVKLPYTPCK